jgi:hypothetical protein
MLALMTLTTIIGMNSCWNKERFFNPALIIWRD